MKHLELKPLMVYCFIIRNNGRFSDDEISPQNRGLFLFSTNS